MSVDYDELKTGQIADEKIRTFQADGSRERIFGTTVIIYRRTTTAALSKTTTWQGLNFCKSTGQMLGLRQRAFSAGTASGSSPCVKAPDRLAPTSRQPYKQDSWRSALKGWR